MTAINAERLAASLRRRFLEEGATDGDKLRAWTRDLARAVVAELERGRAQESG